MSEIPLELFSREILSRLPAEDLLRLRCVCKAWCDFINDPVFARVHFERQLLKIQNPSHGGFHLILRGELCSRLYSLSLQSIAFDGDQTAKTKPLNHNLLERNGVVNLLAESCNGILLINGSLKRERILWNPLTGDYHKLPPLTDCLVSNTSVGLYHSVIGLGYNSVCDDYKIVRIAQVFDPRDKSLRSETLIYSLKLGYWRRIKDLPYRISRLRGGVFLNDSLHWICKASPSKSADDWIVALDLETDDYRLLRLPHFSGLENPAKHLGLLNDCLILSCYHQIDRLDVWLMKDYGDENSWIKLFSIANGDNIGSVVTLRPVFYSRCRGKVLLQHDKKEFLWFDLRTRSSSKIEISGSVSNFSSQICLGSLVRLSGNGGGSANAERPAKDARNKAN